MFRFIAICVWFCFTLSVLASPPMVAQKPLHGKPSAVQQQPVQPPVKAKPPRGQVYDDKLTKMRQAERRSRR